MSIATWVAVLWILTHLTKLALRRHCRRNKIVRLSYGFTSQTNKNAPLISLPLSEKGCERIPCIFNKFHITFLKNDFFVSENIEQSLDVFFKESLYYLLQIVAAKSHSDLIRSLCPVNSCLCHNGVLAFVFLFAYSSFFEADRRVHCPCYGAFSSSNPFLRCLIPTYMEWLPVYRTIIIFIHIKMYPKWITLLI